MLGLDGIGVERLLHQHLGLQQRDQLPVAGRGRRRGLAARARGRGETVAEHADPLLRGGRGPARGVLGGLLAGLRVGGGLVPGRGLGEGGGLLCPCAGEVLLE